MIESINILGTKVEFESKEIKEAYIKGEFAATADVRAFRYSCDLSEVNKAISDLADAQRHYAVTQGYLPTKNDSKILRKPAKAVGELA